MNLSELNTDKFGPERCWVCERVASKWYNSNNPRSENTLEKTIKFLEDAKKTVLKEHYIEVVVRPVYTEADNEDGFGNDFLMVEGWREETDDEYQGRLQQLINEEKHRKHDFDMKKAYFESNSIDKKYWVDHNKEQSEFGFGSEYEKRVAELEKALEKI